MTDEEFRKSMKATCLIVLVLIVMMIALAFLIFNDNNKSKTVFKNETEKGKIEDILEEKANEKITDNEIKEVEDKNALVENVVPNLN